VRLLRRRTHQGLTAAPILRPRARVDACRR
jgi:hypothetical protein